MDDFKLFIVLFLKTRKVKTKNKNIENENSTKQTLCSQSPTGRKFVIRLNQIKTKLQVPR